MGGRQEDTWQQCLTMLGIESTIFSICLHWDVCLDSESVKALTGASYRGKALLETIS